MALVRDEDTDSARSRGRSTPVSFREFALQALILGLLLAVLFPGTFLRGEPAVPGGLLYRMNPWKLHTPTDHEPTRNLTTLESITQFAPWYALTQRAMRNGEWPLWNHLSYGGMPLLGNYQSAVFYPPHILHAFVDVPVAMTVYLLLKLWLCGATAYLCSRAIGLGVSASRFCSIGWMLCGFNTHWCHWAEVDVACWIPVLFMGVELIIDERYRRGFFAMMVGGTLVLLAGHPETAFVAGLGLGMYFVVRLVLARASGGRFLKSMALAGGAWVVALLVCAVQLAPFFEYLLNSYTLAHPERSAGQTAVPYIPSRALIATWVPRFFGSTVDGNFWGFDDTDIPMHLGVKNIHSNYVSILYPGIVAWLAIGFVIPAVLRDRKTRVRVIALAAPLTFGLLMASNQRIVAPLHELPPFSSMWHVWHTNFVVFVLPLLSAFGIEHWQRKRGRPTDMVWPVSLGILIAGLVGLQLVARWPVMSAEGVQGFVLVQIAVAAVLAALALLLCVLRYVSPKPRLVAAALALLLAVDLAVAARHLFPTCPRDQIAPATPLLSYMQEYEKPCRFRVTAASIVPGVMPLYDLEHLWGYDGIIPERLYRFLVHHPAGDFATIERLCAAPYCLFTADTVPHDHERYEFLTSLDGIDVFRDRSAFPRAWVVGDVEVAPDDEAVIARMKQPEFDAATTAVTDQPPDEPLPHGGPAVAANVAFTRWEASEVTMDVDASDDCVLVLADTYYPGWKAWIDDEPATVFPVYHAFRGVCVPKGSHAVRFAYDPLSFRIGFWVSTLVLLIGLAVGLLVLRRTRRLPC
ncbi:MAG: YfhO family protein [bacterium]|nr:YfhO family protein [bacterium]